MLLQNSAQTAENKSADKPMRIELNKFGLRKHLNRTSNTCQTSCNGAFIFISVMVLFAFNFLGHRKSAHMRSLNLCRFGIASRTDHTSVQLPSTIRVSSNGSTTNAIHTRKGNDSVRNGIGCQQV